MDYPAFLGRRVYQGSSGEVYPLPFHERVNSAASPKQWDALHVENEHVRVVILPELGGRIHTAIDRSNDYPFFYCNSVIKPALVGVTGPWISGGVEFNWPQHHRPTTYLPTDSWIERRDDGSVVAWCSGFDHATRMSERHGVLLRPGSSVIELLVTVENPTETTQTFLWWANAAARAGDDYQSFFPDDVYVVADHARRAVTSFPESDGQYYGIDYSERGSNAVKSAIAVHALPKDENGVTLPPRLDDPARLDWYKNIPVPTSYMAVGSTQDFFGGYDHGVQAGFIHHADHSVAVGKKQWTWGNSAFGHAWDANLTEVDGPYVELMAGVFTDNQPDFSFIAPGESKSFSQLWYPISLIGPASAASAEVAVRLDVDPTTTEKRLFRFAMITTQVRDLRITLGDAEGRPLWVSTVPEVGPGAPKVMVEELHSAVAEADIAVLVHDATTGDELLSWAPHREETEHAPVKMATEPPQASEINSAAEAHAIGVHLAQYRHASRKPEPYWRRAIALDPALWPAHLELSKWHYRRAEYREALEFADAAIARATEWNFNPASGEPHYVRGLVLRRLELYGDAIEAFDKAAWDHGFADAARFESGRAALANGDIPHARSRCREMTSAAFADSRVRALRSRLGLPNNGGDSVEQDVLNAAIAGKFLSSSASRYLEIAALLRSLAWDDAAEPVLQMCLTLDERRANGEPSVAILASLQLSEIFLNRGESDAAAEILATVRDASTRHAAPATLDDFDLLRRTVRRDAGVVAANALLGTWLFAAGRQTEALKHWERAAVDSSDAVIHRNLGLARFEVTGDGARADFAYASAIALSGEDSRLIFEYDQLRARTGVSVEERLDHLRRHRRAVVERDDLAVVFSELLVMEGKAQEAREFILSRTFQPWEGGEGRVIGAWDRICIDLSREARKVGDVDAAHSAIEAAFAIPASFGEERHLLSNLADLRYEQALVRQARGDHGAAEESFRGAAFARGDFQNMTPTAVSEKTAFVVRALRALGNEAAAQEQIALWDEWIADRRSRPAAVDYFATSLPDLLLFDVDQELAKERELRVHDAHLLAIRGDQEAARAIVHQVIEEEPAHVLARDAERLLTSEISQSPIPSASATESSRRIHVTP